MSRFFNRNISFQGRLVRGVAGTVLLIAGIILADCPLWLRLALVGLGVFVLFEAVRGWCLVRACRIRTRL